MADPSTNGHGHGDGHAASVVEALRRSPRPPLLARGFGPLVVGVALLVLMLWLAPSVAPEHVVERPKVELGATTRLVPTSTTTVTVAP